MTNLYELRLPASYVTAPAAPGTKNFSSVSFLFQNVYLLAGWFGMTFCMNLTAAAACSSDS